jgi:membrane protein DedA with SNARE-associated domain
MELVQTAASLPAPIFVLIVGALVLFSVAGFPVPITVTLLLSGALSARMPDGTLLFAALVIVVTLCTTVRDVLALLLGRGGGHVWQRFVIRQPLASPYRYDGLVIRQRAIAHPPRRGLAYAMRRRLRRKSKQNTTIFAMVGQIAPQQQSLMLMLTRLSPLATPFDLALGAMGMGLRAYTPPILVGRAIYALLLLGGGALSGTAWERGASIPQLIGLLSLIVLVLLVLPSILSRRLLARA